MQGAGTAPETPGWGQSPPPRHVVQAAGSFQTPGSTPGLVVAAHKSSSAPQRLISHTEPRKLPPFFCQMFLSGSYLGFSQFFAEATWLLVFLGNQTPFKSWP